jgi:hypothetical protein
MRGRAHVIHDIPSRALVRHLPVLLHGAPWDGLRPQDGFAPQELLARAEHVARLTLSKKCEPANIVRPDPIRLTILCGSRGLRTARSALKTVMRCGRRSSRGEPTALRTTRVQRV